MQAQIKVRLRRVGIKLVDEPSVEALESLVQALEPSVETVKLVIITSEM